MTKSKSKTFPKGTEYGDVADWITNKIDTQVATPPEDPDDEPLLVTTAKYIITVTEVVQEVKEE